MKCQHAACHRTLVIDCIQPALVKMFTRPDKVEEIYQKINFNQYIDYYCPIHCQEYGYCWHCGFHHSIPGALNAIGLCKNCEQEAKV